jgi:hypothetical protein
MRNHSNTLINLSLNDAAQVPQKAVLHRRTKAKARVQPRIAMERKRRIVGMKLRNLMRNR